MSQHNRDARPSSPWGSNLFASVALAVLACTSPRFASAQPAASAQPSPSATAKTNRATAAGSSDDRGEVSDGAQQQDEEEESALLGRNALRALNTSVGCAGGAGLVGTIAGVVGAGAGFAAIAIPFGISLESFFLAAALTAAGGALGLFGGGFLGSLAGLAIAGLTFEPDLDSVYSAVAAAIAGVGTSAIAAVAAVWAVAFLFSGAHSDPGVTTLAGLIAVPAVPLLGATGALVAYNIVRSRFDLSSDERE